MAWDTRRGRAPKYGTAHQQARKAAAARHNPTDPCARCGNPLGPMGRWLHLDHAEDGSYLGFSHGSCNKRAGARKGAAIVNASRSRPGPNGEGLACRFCGSPIPLDRTYCSRRCGYLANPNREQRPTRPQQRSMPRIYQVPEPQAGRCAMCADPTQPPSRVYCSPVCATEGNARHARERYRARVGLPATVERPVNRRTVTTYQW